MAQRETDNIRELTRLQGVVKQATEEAARAAGAYEEVMGRIRRDFGCTTIQEAQAKLAELQAASEAAWGAFNTALEKFKEDNDL